MRQQMHRLENATQMYASDAVEATRSGQAAATQNITTSFSCLEYAVTQAKSHKLASAIIGLLFVGGISAAGYWAFFSRGSSSKQINKIGGAEGDRTPDLMTASLKTVVSSPACVC